MRKCSKLPQIPAQKDAHVIIIDVEEGELDVLFV